MSFTESRLRPSKTRRARSKVPPKRLNKSRLIKRHKKKTAPAQHRKDTLKAIPRNPRLKVEKKKKK